MRERKRERGRWGEREIERESERGGERGGDLERVGRMWRSGKQLPSHMHPPQPLLHGGTVTQCNIYILYAHIGFIHVNKEL